MGSSLRWARARRWALAGSAVAGSLAIAAGAAPAGATIQKASVKATYACTATALGKTYNYTGSITVAGTVPASVPVGSAVSMTGWQITVTIPASIVNQVYPYTHTLSGTLKTFNIASTNTAHTVNAAGTLGIKFGPITLTQNQAKTIKLPATPKTIGKWTAGTTGTMYFKTGKVAITLSVLGVSVPVTCAPHPSVVITHTTV